ncbi:hypothetical protein [Amycolatopsis sp. H20-H5]|uniref:hypothetical protein n=1 Tax=Amycolatopsis sp. H20-H5 TaxID=3046309 RepID=UPI002DC00025|nr:hypothetical protein [Amycolatopsis sp. H20-H5]MEC3979820.1 hypothetical protein [Amycolatopsis sp. H20-H5]
MVDAAVDDLTRAFFEGTGRGDSQRTLVVLGYKSYLRHGDTHPDALMRYFQRRFSRLTDGMGTSPQLLP